MSEFEDLVKRAQDLEADAKTGGHTQRVTAYTIAISRKMGLPKDAIENNARAAFLHDIGMIAIPDRILVKPDKLTPDEMAIMKEHAYLGYKIVSKIPFLTDTAEIVYAHHEWYDGTGYPRRLKGNEIPLGARIVSIAEALDAITSNRPYHSAQTFEVARTEILTWAGSQFDPEIVRFFLEMPLEIWEDLRKDIDSP